MLTESAQDQVWLDPGVEETEDRYPEFSKKGEHRKYANIQLNEDVYQEHIHINSFTVSLSNHNCFGFQTMRRYCTSKMPLGMR